MSGADLNLAAALAALERRVAALEEQMDNVSTRTGEPGWRPAGEVDDE